MKDSDAARLHSDGLITYGEYIESVTVDEVEIDADALIDELEGDDSGFAFEEVDNDQ